MESKYLEIIEQTEDINAEIKTVKIKVADKAEAENKLPNAEKEFKDKKYIARYHICRHDDGGNNQPCSVEVLKEVK